MIKLRIGIDGYNLAMPNGTGIASYAFSLASVLNQMDHRVEGVFGIDAGRDEALRETLFFDRLAHPAAAPNTRRQHRRAQRRRWIEAIDPRSAKALDVPLTDLVNKESFVETLPRFARLVSAPRLFERAHSHFNAFGHFLPLRVQHPPEIMHWTYPLPVKLVGSKNIYTVHDLVPLKLPHATLDVKTNYHRLIAHCLANADAICTVSERSAADIGSIFGTTRSPVVNTYQVSALFSDSKIADAPTDAATIKGLFGLESDSYFLFYGAIEPKKNIGRLIEAYLGSDISTPLIIVSSRSWQADAELSLLNAAGECGALVRNGIPRIIRMEHLSRHVLRSLVHGARAVLFPSLYEGFGLPALEAMELGTPVLASNTGSLPEVVGKAAILVNPYDVASIANGLCRLDADGELRQSLARQGPQQALYFSVPAYEKRLTSLYNLAMRHGVAS